MGAVGPVGRLGPMGLTGPLARLDLAGPMVPTVPWLPRFRLGPISYVCVGMAKSGHGETLD